MNKKGISLVALVITIIVLIILTAAVIITGVNTPQGAQQAVEGYNLATVQDAVTLYVLNYITANANTGTVPTTIDAIKQIATVTGAGTVESPYVVGDWKAGAETTLSLSGITLQGKYTLNDKGVVAKV